MEEAHTSFDMEQYKYESDCDLSSVMPDSWIGFARMRIHERGFTDATKAKAEKISARLLEKHDSLSGRKAGETVIKAMDESAGLL